jgi:hypothetical protein
MGGFHSLFRADYKSGLLIHPFTGVLFFETTEPGEVIVNATRMPGNPLTAIGLTQAEIEGRRQMDILIRYLQARIPGFTHAVLRSSGPFIGVRSSRQIVAQYNLRQEDLLSCRRFDDAIAHYCYPIDIHNPDIGETIAVFPKENDLFSIPYRCLLPIGIDNLIVVGRCIGCTFEAQASLRVSPVAGAIGNAGGLAAALSVQSGKPPGDIDIEALRDMIIADGGYLEAADAV